MASRSEGRPFFSSLLDKGEIFARVATAASIGKTALLAADSGGHRASLFPSSAALT